METGYKNCIDIKQNKMCEEEKGRINHWSDQGDE